MGRWIVEVEYVWKKKWLGHLLVATSLAFFLWLNWHLPPSGYAVVAMAVVAGIMAIRPEMEGWERSLWFIVLVCFAIIEIRAINRDREKAQEESQRVMSDLTVAVQQGKSAIEGLETTIKEGRTHFDKTMTEITGLLDQEEGSHKFPYFLAVFPNPILGAADGSWPLMVISSDKYLPIFNVSIVVHDQDLSQSVTEQNIINYFRNSHQINLGTIMPQTHGGTQVGYSIRPPGVYRIDISTRNNVFTEEIRFTPDKPVPLGYVEHYEVRLLRDNKLLFRDGKSLAACCP